MSKETNISRRQAKTLKDHMFTCTIELVVNQCKMRRLGSK